MQIGTWRTKNLVNSHQVKPLQPGQQQKNVVLSFLRLNYKDGIFSLLVRVYVFRSCAQWRCLQIVHKQKHEINSNWPLNCQKKFDELSGCSITLRT